MRDNIPADYKSIAERTRKLLGYNKVRPVSHITDNKDNTDENKGK